MSEMPRPIVRRGRPPKFGRPAQLVTLTLPDDVIGWLKTLHHDPAWAVVKLFEQASRRERRKTELVELVQLPNRRALILINTEALTHLPGVSIIPLADGRGFLALDANKGVADLEITVIDRLEAAHVAPAERRTLAALRDRLREWRQAGIHFESRSIVVAHRGPQAEAPRPLTELRRRRGARGVA